MKLDSIIFDLDGTLWDSTSSVIDSWDEIISSYKGIREKLTIEELKSVTGLETQEMASRIFPNLDEEFRNKIAEQCFENECKYLEKYGAVIYDGLEQTLEYLAKRYKLFIVSNCQNGYIEAFLNSHKLYKYFADHECSGNKGLTKGENIKLIIKRNNLINPIYVGDTDLDLNASKFAGIPFIYASYGFGKAEGYDYLINSIRELVLFV